MFLGGIPQSLTSLEWACARTRRGSLSQLYGACNYSLELGPCLSDHATFFGQAGDAEMSAWSKNYQVL